MTFIDTQNPSTISSRIAYYTVSSGGGAAISEHSTYGIYDIYTNDMHLFFKRTWNSKKLIGLKCNAYRISTDNLSLTSNYGYCIWLDSSVFGSELNTGFKSQPLTYSKKLAINFYMPNPDFIHIQVSRWAGGVSSGFTISDICLAYI